MPVYSLFLKSAETQPITRDRSIACYKRDTRKPVLEQFVINEESCHVCETSHRYADGGLLDGKLPRSLCQVQMCSNFYARTSISNRSC